eukprot:403348823
MFLQPIQTTRNLSKFASGTGITGGSQSITSHMRHNSTNSSVFQKSEEKSKQYQVQRAQMLNNSYQTQLQVEKQQTQRGLGNQITKQVGQSEFDPNQINQTIGTNFQSKNQTIQNDIVLHQDDKCDLNQTMLIPQQSIRKQNNSYLPKILRAQVINLDQINSNLVTGEPSKRNETALIFQQLKDNRKDLIRNHRQLLSHQKSPSINNSSRQRTFTSHNTNLSQTATNENIVQELLRINQQTLDKNLKQTKLRDYSISIRNSYDSYNQSSKQRLIEKDILSKQSNDKGSFKQQNQSQQRALSLLFNSYKSNLNQNFKNQIRGSLQTAAISVRSQQHSQSPQNVLMKNENRNLIDKLIQKQKTYKAFSEFSPSKNSSIMRSDQNQRRNMMFQNKQEIRSSNQTQGQFQQDSLNQNLNSIISPNPTFNESLSILQSQQEQFIRKHKRTQSRSQKAPINTKFVRPLKNTAAKLNFSNLIESRKDNKPSNIIQSLNESSLILSTQDYSSKVNTSLTTGQNKHDTFFLTETGTQIIQQDTDINLLDDNAQNTFQEETPVSLNIEKFQSMDSQLIKTEQATEIKLQEDSTIRSQYQTHIGKFIDKNTTSPIPKAKVKFYNNRNQDQFQKQATNSTLNQTQQISFKQERNNTEIINKSVTVSMKNNQKEASLSNSNNRTNEQSKFMKLMKFDLDEEFNKINKMMYQKSYTKRNQNANQSLNQDSIRIKHKTQGASRRVRFDIQSSPVHQIQLFQPET